jgi:hypothetical protein
MSGHAASSAHQRRRRRALMISLADQLAAAQREVRLRKQVYPRLIAQGKMTAVEADYQIRVMEAIGKTLHRLDAEERQMSLFRTEA